MPMDDNLLPEPKHVFTNFSRHFFCYCNILNFFFIPKSHFSMKKEILAASSETKSLFTVLIGVIDTFLN